MKKTTKKPLRNNGTAKKKTVHNNKSDNGLVPVSIKTHNDKKGGHPHVIVNNVDDKHVSVGITHEKKKGKNSPNYAMESNPLGGSEKSYMHRQGTVDSKKAYYGNRKGKVTENDYDKLRNYADKAKNKYIAKKCKKK